MNVRQYLNFAFARLFLTQRTFKINTSIFNIMRRCLAFVWVSFPPTDHVLGLRAAIYPDSPSWICVLDLGFKMIASSCNLPEWGKITQMVHIVGVNPPGRKVQCSSTGQMLQVMAI